MPEEKILGKKITQLKGEVSFMTEFGELTGIVGMTRDKQKTFFFPY